REDFARKTASALVRSSDRMTYEALQLRNLVRSHRLAKSLHGAAWARSFVWVVYYGKLQRIPILAVQPQYTTPACSGCGRLVEKTLGTRTHRCPSYGLVLDLYENAARNILARALVSGRPPPQSQQNRFSTAGQAGSGSA